MKMFDNSNTRIFLQGNEAVARWHLPVVLSKFKAFVRRCKGVGLKQDRFTMFFEDTGTSVFGQYFYGEESIQLYSPFRQKVIGERSKIDSSAKEIVKTFYVVTSQGYFWVEVRQASVGNPVVVLTKFAATVTAADGITESFVYPGFALASPGMVTGCFNDDPASRYVLSQNCGVMIGNEQEKGTIKMPANANPASRITVIGPDKFSIIHSDKGQDVSVRVVDIVNGAEGIEVALKYFELNTLSLAESGELSVAVLHPNPCWIHRKCTGSYFSPNKTIGYHVDIGSDDDFFGNSDTIPGIYRNKLDNPAGDPYFNHTNDLYRFASLCAFPLAVEEGKITILALAPTMYFSGTEDDRCWGGNGISQIVAGCLDYAGDSLTWILAPRFIRIEIVLSTGAVEFSDLSVEGEISRQIAVQSWDGLFSATLHCEADYLCDNFFFEEEEVKQSGPSCTWSSDCAGTCGVYTDPEGYLGECPGQWTPYQQWAKFFRENLKNSKRFYLALGTVPPNFDSPGAVGGFYFLFDGLWHLDGGVLWSNAAAVGNACALCSVPVAGQSPGEIVYFSLMGGDSDDWILTHGHEYTENMTVLAPLGYHSMPDATGSWGTRLGFIVQVPEDVDEEHEVKVLVGGVSYPASNVDGGVVKCERRFMNDPCLCEETMEWSAEHGVIEVGETLQLTFTGGCPPFIWLGTNVIFRGSSGEVLSKAQLALTRTVYADASGGCYSSVNVSDACGDTLSASDTKSGTGVATGPSVLNAGDIGYFSHNMTYEVEYTGSLDYVSGSGSGIALRMPSGASPGSYYTASWSDGCGATASVSVLCSPNPTGSLCLAPSSGNYYPAPRYMSVDESGYRHVCWEKQSYSHGGSRSMPPQWYTQSNAGFPRVIEDSGSRYEYWFLKSVTSY